MTRSLKLSIHVLVVSADLLRQPTGVAVALSPSRSTAISGINASADGRPALDDLPSVLEQIEPLFAAARSARGTGYVNHEGGDVGGHSTERSLIRHVANYLAAAELAEQAGVHDSVLDVGSGTGALTAWLASRLDAEMHLVDRDPAVRQVAVAAFPHAHVHAALDEVPRKTVGLVTAMEVVEHIRPDEQQAFITALTSRVEPGGLLVLSTPDESGYVGGWSGYAPHVGTLDAPALHDLLSAGAPPGAGVRVWRLQGDPFHLGTLRRVVQPLANRLWTGVSRVVDPIAHRLVGPAAKLADTVRTHAGPQLLPEVRAVPAGEGDGTGLIGVVHLPR